MNCLTVFVSGFARSSRFVCNFGPSYCNGILGTGNENVARKAFPSKVVRAPVSQKYRRFEKPNKSLLLVSGTNKASNSAKDPIGFIVSNPLALF